MKKPWLRFLCASVFAGVAHAQSDKPLLLQSPSLSKTDIAFAYGGSLWTVSREGGDARRLVVGDPGWATGPLFSPDGQQVAFTANFDGNQDVYVVAAAGGQPRRLTSHPNTDVAVGWTPDGQRVIFRSTRDSNSARYERLFTVPVTGGFPTELPLPMGVQASFSADGTQLAYVPRWNRRGGAGDSYVAIKHYRGGLTAPIWIARLEDSSVTALPRENSNDFNPMWIGDRIYFLSDRTGLTTLFSYDVKTRETKQLVKHEGFDLVSAAAGPGAIVYEQFGSLHVYSLSTGQEHAVPVHIAADLPQARPHFEKVASKQILNAGLSPSGARAVFEARGEIFTVPAEKGDVRNLTHTPGIADRAPAWSPDGKWIAYFSDESGEYALHLRDQTGLGVVRKIELGSPPSFFYELTWSPDSKKIAYSDKRLNLWYVDLDHPKPVRVDTDRIDTPLHRFDANWSPDSRWIAYTKQLVNNLRAVYVYSVETAKTAQVTDGMSDALYPAFDRNGKALYFTASTDMGLTAGWLDMSSDAHPVTRQVYVAVLGKDLPSPIAPESDEEKDEKEKDAKKPDSDTPDAKPRVDDAAVKVAASDEKTGDAKSSDTKSEEKGDEAKKKEAAKKIPTVAIDFEGIGQRILALPIPARNYDGLVAGKEGIVYLLEAPPVDLDEGPTKVALQRFDLKTRKTEKLLDGVEQFELAAKAEKMMWRADGKWFIGAADKAPKAGEGGLKLDSFDVAIDPQAEWRQMYREVWRIERDFFYDPHYHGLDLAMAEKVYEPFVDGIASRADLNYLFGEMLGQLSVQHMFVGGGAKPELKAVNVGLLGADYRLVDGRYQFSRIFDGENWNPKLKAPLTQPGVNVKAGEFLLAVDGRDLRASDEIYGFFLGTANKQLVLRVGPKADGQGARDVTVVPVDNESGLRNLAWIEGNRRKVDELSGGKLAYVYLPNTAGAGYTNFNRYYFAQVGKLGAVIDERYNGGGQLADYIIDYLRRPLMSLNLSREGEIAHSPASAIYGPKAMIINEFAGSGGDAMPWYFRKANVGPLVGMKTWGGLVGIGGYPQLIDGGTVTAPRWALFGLTGQWEVENIGIAPDVQVELDPKAVRQGHDPQLEKAVEVVMDLLKKNPLPETPVPTRMDYHPHLPALK
ncbi:MAG: protease [Verrucomicrobia bacterium]|nr:protease [Verrucomicrobiota bacterium]